MKLLFKTKILLLLAFLAVGLNFFERPMEEKKNLPSIPAMTKDEIQRIELTTAAGKILLQKKADEWHLLAPFQQKADKARIRSLILNFRKKISMDVMLERGNIEKYGLDPNNVIVAEFWTGSDKAAASFSIGFDADHGTTFVRISGDDAIYRARIGGRRRFMYTAEEWKNQVLLDFQLDEVKSLKITAKESFQILPKEKGSWKLEPAPDWKINEQKITQILQRLGRLRIGRQSQKQLKNPSLELLLSLQQGKQRELKVQLDKDALVQITGEKESYQVSASVFSLLYSGREAFRDRRIFSFQARDQLDTIQYEDKQQKIVLQQDLSNGFWTVIEPSNMDLELKNIFFMVNSIATLEARKIEDNIEGAMLGAADFNIKLRMLTGKEYELALWERSGEPLAKRNDDPRFFHVSTEIISKIKKAFGRGQ